MNNLVVVTPLEHEKKLQKPPIRTILLLSRPWNTKKILVRKNNWSEKKLGAKKIQIFLLKLTIKKILRPPQEIIQVFHTLMLYLFVR